MLGIKSFKKKLKSLISRIYFLKFNFTNGKKFKSRSPKNLKEFEKVYFIYRSKYKETASTLMRCFQLQKILKDEGAISVELADEKHINNINNSICILNKSFLINAIPREFEVLLLNNNIICLDYIDSLPKTFQIKYSHALIASSYKQKIYFLEKFKDKLIKHIPHNVDPRFNKKYIDNNFLNIGYFGEKDNGLYLDDLSCLVDCYFINTKKNKNQNWINNINKYNAHYIIRRIENKKVFKPFLKGFTAAHNNSNIIAYINDGDSLYYLGIDYPYLLKDKSLKNILKMISYMKESYKSKEWYEGLEIIKNIKYKSSNRFIINEFKDLIICLKQIA
tara:strand:- start:6088 stop:7089 length:1002 start_codon:yes stop_codon:yes gene_type:complete